MDKNSVRILLVDDAQIVRVMIRRLLGELGFFTVDDAGGGREALDKIGAASANGLPYTVVFCDWMMDGVDGIQVLEECRRNPATKDLPIVMVTAESESKSMVRAMKAGANDYLVKPVTVATLGPKIDRVLARLNTKTA